MTLDQRVAAQLDTDEAADDAAEEETES